MSLPTRLQCLLKMTHIANASERREKERDDSEGDREIRKGKEVGKGV